MGVSTLVTLRPGLTLQSEAAAPSVTGSRAGNAALNGLLNELAIQGLITNSTSA